MISRFWQRLEIPKNLPTEWNSSRCDAKQALSCPRLNPPLNSATAVKTESAVD
jgi:hypothetical protein